MCVDDRGVCALEPGGDAVSARTPTTTPVIRRTDAKLSADGRYRYMLLRWFQGVDEPCAVWVMLNPSTADAFTNDPTIRRVMSFSKGWGYGGCIVLNLFALRATYPSALMVADDPVGPDNDQVLRDWFALAGRGPLIAAWGAINSPRLRWRVSDVLRLGERPWMCLGRTLDGSPRHPLYVRADTELQPWTP